MKYKSNIENQQSFLKRAKVAKVSPNWVKKADKKATSSWDLSLAISQANNETKLTKAQGFIQKPHKTNIYNYYMKIK